VPWTRPAARMREYVLALRAIWSAWETGEPLRFEGEFSTHTLMPPAFRPRPQPHGAAPVWLAAVRERMIEVAGEVADGLLVHPLQSPRYLAEVVRPALARGAARGGRDPSEVAVSVAQLVATTPAELEAVRARVAFYGSTPGYRHVLALHGLDDLFGELHELSRTGGWDRMSALVDDDVLRTFVAYAESPGELAADLRRRTDGVDRVALHSGAAAAPESWSDIVRAFRT
jgi:probable F420-dependent oxidoreductase